MASPSDDAITDRAFAEDAVVVTADTDFGTILARRRTAAPSVVLFRGAGRRSPGEQAVAIERLPADVLQALETGALVVIEQSRTRVRALPILD
jgi:predicted nuclease of predicted toxin-antitoxin system